LLEQIADFPIAPLLVFTGGDPFKRSDLRELVQHATCLGLEVAVTPSATPLVTREALAGLWHAGASRIAVSLDGPDAASHDCFRGVSGSFCRTLEVIHDARSLGLPVQVNTTVSLQNWQRMGEFAALLDGLDIVLWSVFFLVPVGRAVSQPRLNADQVEQVFGQLWHEARRRRFPIKTTEAPHYRRFAAQQEKPPSEQPRPPRKAYSAAATNDGKGIMFVAHDGAIYPSGFMPITCGVFPKDNLVQTYQRSALFQALRDPQRLKGKCGVCKFRTLCGGSRARSYAVNGDPLSAEPDCAYLPEGWSPAASDSQSSGLSQQGIELGL
jgi:radical SAM protein with 4Fe4S-binding SPASM domain